MRSLLPLLVGLCVSCHNDGADNTDLYPPLITEFMDLMTDATGNGSLLRNDKGATFLAESPLKDLQPEAVYRMVVGYALTGQSENGIPTVTLYNVERVEILREDEETGNAADPLRVNSVWKGGGYINMNLSPLSQGGEHQWGYRTAGVTETATGQTWHVDLVHNQGDDPQSWSVTTYASLPLDYLDELQEGDSIAFTIQTFDGKKTWRFAF